MSDYTTTEWTTALNECVADRLAENGVVGPPVDVLCLAARLGFLVVYDDRMDGRARRVQLHGYASDSATTILIRPEPRSERIQWSVAHEIGEHFVFDVWRRLGVEPDDLPPSERERTANALANRLLLPSPWFDDFGRECDWNLMELKSRFATASFELIARRMLEVDDVPAIVTIVDRQRLSFRRGHRRFTGSADVDGRTQVVVYGPRHGEISRARCSRSPDAGVADSRARVETRDHAHRTDRVLRLGDGRCEVRRRRIRRARCDAKLPSPQGPR